MMWNRCHIFPILRHRENSSVRKGNIIFDDLTWKSPTDKRQCINSSGLPLKMCINSRPLNLDFCQCLQQKLWAVGVEEGYYQIPQEHQLADAQRQNGSSLKTQINWKIKLKSFCLASEGLNIMKNNQIVQFNAWIISKIKVRYRCSS